MNCSFCGTALQVGVAYCPSCGSPTPYKAQEPGQVVQNSVTPLSSQPSGERQAVNGYAGPPLPSSKLSSYKPTGLPASKLAAPLPSPDTASNSSASIPKVAPGSKLSHYGQASTQPSKLSDYKQPSVQRGKLFDYKTSANPGMGPTSTPNHDALASMPTAPSPFNAAKPPSPIPGPSSSPSIMPIATNPPGIQPVYPQTVNMGNMTNTANPSSFVPTREGYTPNPARQVGASPIPGRSKQKGLLMGSVAVILLIVCIGAASFFFLQGTNNNKHVASTTKIAATPMPTATPIHGPSGNTSVPAASALFSEPQMTAGIDYSNKAKQITSAFTTGQTVYVTFSLNSKGQQGYVKAKWYKGKQLFQEVNIAHDPSKTNDYFSVVYDSPTTDASVELYWSTTANFSNAKLARLAHFTVTK